MERVAAIAGTGLAGRAASHHREARFEPVADDTPRRSPEAAGMVPWNSMQEGLGIARPGSPNAATFTMTSGRCRNMWSVSFAATSAAESSPAVLPGPGEGSVGTIA